MRKSKRISCQPSPIGSQTESLRGGFVTRQSSPSSIGMSRNVPNRFHPSSLIPHPSESGVALVLTLGILALVTLLLVAFVTSMRVENMASKNFNDLIKARQLAHAAVDQAVANIRQATPVRTYVLGPPPAFTTYVTSPGLIYSYVCNGGLLTLTRYPLYTQNAADTIDLNDTTHNSYWITGNNGEFTLPGNSQINVGWVYVADNGTVGVPPLSRPIIGRFAYWVDDEACKVNINQAWTRGVVNTSITPNTYSSANSAYGDTSEVDLSMLLPSVFPFVSGIQAQRSPNPFRTIQELVRADPTFPDPTFYSTYYTPNQFSIGTRSNDSGDLNVFGRTRLVLSPLAGSGLSKAKDLDDTTGPNSAYTRLSDTALSKVYPSGGTFTTKYPVVTVSGNNYNGLKQIIANIIAYQIDPTTTAPPDGGGDPPAYLGRAKTPYVNEVQVKYDVKEDPSNPGHFNLTRTVSVELLYMYGKDGSTYTAAPDQITVTGLPDLSTFGFSKSPNISIAGSFSGVPSASSAYQVGSISETYPLTSPQLLRQGAVEITYSRGSARLNVARVNFPSANLFLMAASIVQDFEVNDPALNEIPNQWTAAGAGTLGQKNNAYAPPGGDDSKSLVMRGAPMQSVGELGYIHTPVTATGTPWGHLTFQPEPPADYALSEIPDWVMLDLFTAGQATVGRININSLITASPAPTTPRLVPLKALLNNAISTANRDAVAQNIYNQNYFNVSDTFGQAGVFDTIGELCEVTGLDDGKTTQADKEATIRRVANLLSVRSNAFTIWAIAEGIRDVNQNGQFNPSPGGSDYITGEVKVQAVVERVEDTSLLVTDPNYVKFRIKYLRYYYQ